jgi:hypothetical protein
MTAPHSKYRNVNCIYIFLDFLDSGQDLLKRGKDGFPELIDFHFIEMCIELSIEGKDKNVSYKIAVTFMTGDNVGKKTREDIYSIYFLFCKG